MAIKNVMVVDDSPTEVHLLREMLTKNGFTVSVASSGEEAITRAACGKARPYPHGCGNAGDERL